MAKKIIKNRKKIIESNKIIKTCCFKSVNFWQGLTYLVLILTIILVGLKLWLLTKQYEQIVDKNTYQVVALDNNETYFGKLENIGFKYYKLSDVYYLKYFPKIQQTEESVSQEAKEDYELKLISLGSQESYKPENTMILNKDKIIHWENLQTDSEVMKYILENQK